LHEKNFEIIAAAQDTGGEAAAGKWYDAAKATYTTLIDTKHSISSAYQFINVPMGIWVDEKGRVVRPAEPAWTTDQTMRIGAKNIVTEGTAYLTALRDWVANGESSKFALSDEEFARRVKPRSPAEMESDASFKLAVYFHEKGNNELAEKYWQKAQALNPDDWNYHRQDWSFTPDQAGKKWLEKFNKLDAPYYPKLDIKP
jgi:tetratricopeptide (TPR) repeat protein